MRRFLILSAFVLSATLIGPAVEQTTEIITKNATTIERGTTTIRGTTTKTMPREFNSVNRGQQQPYFNWRHEHPDSALIKVEIR